VYNIDKVRVEWVDQIIPLTFSFNNEPVIITGAGNYGDEEALLRWRKDKNSVSSPNCFLKTRIVLKGLWINDPLIDLTVCGKKRTVLSAGSVKRAKSMKVPNTHDK
jgi:hypothetical protein